MYKHSKRKRCKKEKYYTWKLIT